MKNRKINICELFELVKNYEAPKRIKFRNKIYELMNDEKDYKEENDVGILSTHLRMLFEGSYLKTVLQMNVDILPDSKDWDNDFEYIEKLDYKDTEDYKNIDISINRIAINLLIENQRRIIERLNKDGK